MAGLGLRTVDCARIAPDWRDIRKERWAGKLYISRTQFRASLWKKNSYLCVIRISFVLHSRLPTKIVFRLCTPLGSILLDKEVPATNGSDLDSRRLQKNTDIDTLYSYTARLKGVNGLFGVLDDLDR